MIERSNKTDFSFIQITITIIKRCLPLLISIGCLLLIFTSAERTLNFNETKKILVEMNKSWGIFVFFLAIAMVFVNSFRFALISQWVANQRPDFSFALKLTWLSYFIALSLPFAAMGDAARAALIKWQMRMSVSHSIEVVLFDRGFSLYCLVLLTFLSSIFCFKYFTQPLILFTQIYLPVGSLALLFLIIILHRFIPWPNNKIGNFLSRLIDKLILLLKQPRYMSEQLIISICNIALYVASFIALAYALHFSFSIFNLILFAPVMLIINNLPFFYLGWGGREAVFLILLPILAPHTNSESLIAASMSYGVITMLAALCGGFYMLTLVRKDY